MRLTFDKKTSSELVYRGQSVMTAGEEPYLDALIRQFAGMPVGRLLEVGYGLGITARLIQRHVKPDEHHIIEVEEGLCEDAVTFCQEGSGRRAIHGDFFRYAFGDVYDLLFYDPYDYDIPADAPPPSEEQVETYRTQMVFRASEVVRPGGILCHPFFGDMPMPELTGFSLSQSAHFEGPPFHLWDGSLCYGGRIGFYVRHTCI